MYKYLLCWRYLKMRYIALASVISVTLGVATMIVVNGVMEGFTCEMQNRLHGILSDIIVESRDFSGMYDADAHIAQIRQTVGDKIEAITPTVVVPAMVNFQHYGQWISRPIQLIGIDANTQSQVSDFGRYLQHPENRKKMSFNLRDGGFDVRDHQGGPGAAERKQLEKAGWQRRREQAQLQKIQEQLDSNGSSSMLMPKSRTTPRAIVSMPPAFADEMEDTNEAGGIQTVSAESTENPPATLPQGSYQASPIGSPSGEPMSNISEYPPLGENDETANERPKTPPPDSNPWVNQIKVEAFDMARQQRTGAVVGIALASIRRLKNQADPSGGVVDNFLFLPGDDIRITFPTVAKTPTIVNESFTVVDFYESKMSEYDAGFIFVPIRALQELRGMINPSTGVANVNSIEIKLKPGVSGDEVRDQLAAVFPPEYYVVDTWRDRQGPLLAAVWMETAILNVLLFLIIAVAGFGILAIFFMIVVEKTKDIGILKSLGASSGGIMGIFLSYGLLLGLVGSGAGLILGLLFIRYINEIADLLGYLTGRPVFDPTIYYFYRIPTIIEPQTILWVMVGAMGIAVAASILPARRAARQHPVEALRYE